MGGEAIDGEGLAAVALELTRKYQSSTIHVDGRLRLQVMPKNLHSRFRFSRNTLTNSTGCDIVIELFILLTRSLDSFLSSREIIGI
jgi:hypothetical protein